MNGEKLKEKIAESLVSRAADHADRAAAEISHHGADARGHTLMLFLLGAAMLVVRMGFFSWARIWP